MAEANGQGVRRSAVPFRGCEAAPRCPVSPDPAASWVLPIFTGPVSYLLPCSPAGQPSIRPSNPTLPACLPSLYLFPHFHSSFIFLLRLKSLFPSFPSAYFMPSLSSFFSITFFFFTQNSKDTENFLPILNPPYILLLKLLYD